MHCSWLNYVLDISFHLVNVISKSLWHHLHMLDSLILSGGWGQVKTCEGPYSLLISYHDIASQYTLPDYWGNYHLETKRQKKTKGGGGGGVIKWKVIKTKTQRKHEARKNCGGESGVIPTTHRNNLFSQTFSKVLKRK